MALKNSMSLSGSNQDQQVCLPEAPHCSDQNCKDSFFSYPIRAPGPFIKKLFCLFIKFHRWVPPFLFPADVSEQFNQFFFGGRV